MLLMYKVKQLFGIAVSHDDTESIRHPDAMSSTM